MTEQSMFFEDGTHYHQNLFARMWKDIFGHNGVVTGNGNQYDAEVNTPANMSVKIKTGRAYVQGYVHEVLTDPVSLTIEASDTTNPRIDRIILRLDVAGLRKVYLAVLKGTAAASPVAPTLTQTDSIYEIPMYQITVRANTTSIIATDITADDRDYLLYTREFLPIGSKTDFGALKVGNGLDVAGGVVSLSAITVVGIPNVATTNSNGFKVGKLTQTLTSCGASGGLGDGSAIILASWKPYETPIQTNYPPFVPNIPITPIPFTMTFTFSFSAQYPRGVWGGVTAKRVSDNSSLGGCGYSDSYTPKTISGTITLPADWDYENDRIYLVFENHTSGSAEGKVSCSCSGGVTASTLTQEYYFTNPTGS